MRIWPGRPSPLGATFDGVGTNVAIFSEVADSVELCLFDDDGTEQRVELPERSGAIFHGYLPEMWAGARYGFRVHGRYDPASGHRCDPSKLLIDPYAKAIDGGVHWDPSVLSFFETDRSVRNTDDSGPFVPKGVVVNPYFDWDGDHLLHTPWADTVIYEVHTRGATLLHPGIEPSVRGTYAGIAHPVFIEHLKGLGVTAVELLPVHQLLHDLRLSRLGLRNYWGYNTVGYFAPHDEYASRGSRGQQVTEFKQMVATLHRAGIEVILDVVYNHTAEGNHLGPTLSFRGIDNAAYYRLADDRSLYKDYTGTGNTLNMRQPYVLQLVMDSLRYWVTEMHVDGFRFDLASALARSMHEVDRLSAFFDLVQQDPVISQVKLIAEPWDVGDGGYQVGNFPPQWAEWNGKYRDCVRDHWAGSPHGLGELAYRLTGSSDLYEAAGRRPHASINFVTCHDGFTLRDLVSYNVKHNLANGEDGRDGESHNRSWNCGVEGETDDPAVLALRDRQRRNLLTTLLLSQGVPMLLGGDELGHTQRGNNNCYCQDNELSWFDWSNVDHRLHDFVARLVAFRARHKGFRRRRFFQGRALHGEDVGDLHWLRPGATTMTEQDWSNSTVRAMTMYLSGRDIETDSRGELVQDDAFLVMINASDRVTDFVVPDDVPETDWTLVIDTETGIVEPTDPAHHRPGDKLRLVARSIVVLREFSEPTREWRPVQR